MLIPLQKCQRRASHLLDVVCKRGISTIRQIAIVTLQAHYAHIRMAERHSRKGSLRRSECFMPGKRQRPTAADAAAVQADSESATVNSAAEQTATESEVSDNNLLADANVVAPDASGSVDMPVSTPVQDAESEVAQIEAALGVTTAPVLRSVLESTLTEARGRLAMLQAQAALELERIGRLTEAESAAEQLPESVRAAALAAMRSAIEADYAPVQTESESESESAPTVGRKSVGTKQAALNMQAATEYSADSARAIATLQAFESKWLPLLIGVGRNSGTRYPSIVALGGTDGIANRADYANLTAQIRTHMRFALNIDGSGNGTANDPWLFASGIHAPGFRKDEDTLRLKFANRAELALHSDNRFRLTAPNTPNVRYVRSDAAAMALWTGGSVSAPQNAQNAQQTTEAPQAPAVPTAPKVQASAVTGALTPLANCQYCQTRNPIGALICRMCDAPDWHAESS